MLVVTSLTAVPLALLFQRLSLNVVKTRRGSGVPVGDGGNEALTRAIRAQANLLEYSVVFLGLLALAETNGIPWWALAPVAAAFLLGRGFHVYSLLKAELLDDGRTGLARYRWRIRGMVITLTAIPIMAVMVLVSLVLPLIAG